MNRDILVFNSFVKALNRSYRNLCEMLLLSMFLNECVKRDRHDYAELSIRLPYVADNNAALGMVTKYYLKHTVSDQSKAMEAIENSFTTAVDLKRDLHKGFGFWDNVMKGIKVLKEAKSFEATCNMFLEADEWLKSRRPQN
ncbi:temperature dependent protein affecting M2 dsRNA replication [Umbelopsis sp. PMI_123]|nr:temperature dependent protein affecting M2 dsRNA replication [Umbelopsis sp. PMI_123]